MDTVTRTFPINLSSSYIANSIIELCHFRDMNFDADERVGIYLESFFCNLNLKSFSLGVIPDFDGSESEIEKMSKFNATETKSQKVGLRILARKDNIGNWGEVAEIILVNRGRKDYFDLLIPYLAKNQVSILETNDALAIQLIDYGNGLLKEDDSLRIQAGISITISKKNDIESLQARISALELALEGKLIDLPENTFLGRDVTTGTVQSLPQSRFATSAQIEIAVANKAPTANPTFTGIIGTEGRIMFPAVQIPSPLPNVLDDYLQGTFTPTIIGTSTEGTGTYITRTGTFTKIGNRVLFDLFVEWTEHSGTGSIRITGLPYTPGNGCCTIWHRNLTLSNNYSSLQANFLGTTTGTIISLTQVPVGGGTIIGLLMDTSGGIMCNGTYLASN